MMFATTNVVRSLVSARGGLLVATTCAVVMIVSSTARADTIISFHSFNDMLINNNGTSAVTVENAVGTPMILLVEDSGTADSDGAKGTPFVDADGTPYPAEGRSASWTDGILEASSDPEDYWELDLSTEGYQDLQLRFDYRLTSTTALLGPTELTIAWSVDGGDLTEIDTYTLTRNNEWHEFTLDLSSISALENAANIQLRGTWSNDGSIISGSSTPSARLDNLQLTGSEFQAVPEPGSFVLCLGGLVMLGIGRLRLRHS